MEVIREVSGAPAPIGPYSPAVVSKGMVYCSGQIALNPETGKLVHGSIQQQAKQVLSNLSNVLTEAGSSFENVVMTTIFLTDIHDFAEVNEVYGTFVNSEAPPARQTVGVRELPLGAKLEISVIAEKS